MELAQIEVWNNSPWKVFFLPPPYFNRFLELMIFTESWNSPSICKQRNRGLNLGYFKARTGLTLLPREFVTIVPHRSRTDCTALSVSVGPAKDWLDLNPKLTRRRLFFCFFMVEKDLGKTWSLHSVKKKSR